MTTPVMACGCRSQGMATAISGVALTEPIPICIVHGVSEKIPVMPDLTGRMAMCLDCRKQAPSSPDLPFWRYEAAQTYDSMYDGCKGWD